MNLQTALAILRQPEESNRRLRDMDPPKAVDCFCRTGTDLMSYRVARTYEEMKRQTMLHYRAYNATHRTPTSSAIPPKPTKEEVKLALEGGPTHGRMALDVALRCVDNDGNMIILQAPISLHACRMLSRKNIDQTLLIQILTKLVDPDSGTSNSVKARAFSLLKIGRAHV